MENRIPDTVTTHLIGVLDNGLEGLTPQALSLIARADLVIGGTRTLALFAAQISLQAERRDLTGALAQVPAWIGAAQAAGQRVVVLATGDPLCHGLGAYLLPRLAAGSCLVLPNVSTLQLACARLGLPWQAMKILSVHGRDSGEWQPGAGPEHALYPLLQATQHAERLAVFTSPANTPDRIARLLVESGRAAFFRMAVAERLAQAEERVLPDLDPAEAATLRFAEPNIVLLCRTQPAPRRILFGLPDASYQQRQPDKGLITKREVRAVSLARMQLCADSIVWDIGAGSGAVGLEAARLCPAGHVYAIEKNADDFAIASANQRAADTGNYTLIHGKAPQGLAHWPDPDAVFVGGSGGELAALIPLLLSRLKAHGTLVMNFVCLENLALAMTALKAADAYWDVTQIQTARSRPLLDMHRLAAETPVWVVVATKADSEPPQI